MLLGDPLNQFEDEGVAAETILRVGDLAMIAAMTRGAEAAGDARRLRGRDRAAVRRRRLRRGMDHADRADGALG